MKPAEVKMVSSLAQESEGYAVSRSIEMELCCALLHPHLKVIQGRNLIAYCLTNLTCFIEAASRKSWGWLTASAAWSWVDDPEVFEPFDDVCEECHLAECDCCNYCGLSAQDCDCYCPDCNAPGDCCLCL